MNTDRTEGLLHDRIEELLHEAAEEIRKYVVSQLEAWRAIPYWTLEAEGRGGWSDNAHIAYTHGLLGVGSGWPYSVFVELCSGRLVSSSASSEVIDKAVVNGYLASPSSFDASSVLGFLVKQATDGRDSFNKERNDRKREKLRQKYQVPTVWTEPATPIRYGFNP